MADLRIECAHDKLVPLGEIKPHPKNPNRHSSEQIVLLSKIILKNGFRAPICISERSGFITRGHARFAAATYLGATVVPVDYQKYATEEEEIGDMLADNHIAELSERDTTLLRDILSSFPQEQLDLTSYTPVDLKALYPPELDITEADLKERLEIINPKPVQRVEWILLGVPLDKHGVVQPHIAALEREAEITVRKTTT